MGCDMGWAGRAAGGGDTAVTPGLAGGGGGGEAGLRQGQRGHRGRREVEAGILWKAHSGPGTVLTLFVATV